MIFGLFKRDDKYIVCLNNCIKMEFLLYPDSGVPCPLSKVEFTRLENHMYMMLQMEVAPNSKIHFYHVLRQTVEIFRSDICHVPHRVLRSTDRVHNEFLTF